MAVADLVKTTLGPKGMDKILQSMGRGKSVTVTNDGATILKSIYIDNPAARVLVDLSRVQDDEVGDGTTSVVVLAGELLREAEKLVSAGVHPMTVVAGYRAAADAALAALESGARAATGADLRPALEAVARTTLCSKILSHDKDQFATLAVDAVLRLGPDPDLDMIHILKKAGGTLAESWLEDGFILDKTPGVGQPKRIDNATILVANTAMDTDKVKIYGARVRVDSMAAVAELEAAEKGKMKAKVDAILALGPSVFVNRQLIYNYPESLFADAGVMAVEHADFDGVERLAKVTGAEVASTFDAPPTATAADGTAPPASPSAVIRLGRAAVVEEVTVGGDRVVRFGGCARAEAATVVLRGASAHVLDEAERSLHDALCVLGAAVRDARVVWGGGWPEVRKGEKGGTRFFSF
jgi:T-complex protein 1 subunit beta